MKQITRYRFLTIPNKVRCELRIVVDSNRGVEYTSTSSDSNNTGLTLAPMISLSIIKPVETDDNGQRVQAQWNPNDTLLLTKYSLPIFNDELKHIIRDMKIPELYTYTGKRLELNETIADKVRRVFMVNNTAIEFSPVVIISNDEQRVEGIKIKFNNEQSSVMLTLNELTSLSNNMCKFDVDTMSLLLYMNYISRPDKPKEFNAMNNPLVDIVPKNATDFV